MEAARSSSQIVVSHAASNSGYWEVDDVLRNATLNNLKRSLLAKNDDQHTPDQGSLTSDSNPSTPAGGQQEDYWEVDDVLDPKNLANVANWTTPQNELSTSDSMEGISDGSQLQENMIYKIHSNSEVSADETVFAVWDGKKFVPIDPCLNQTVLTESVKTPAQSPRQNGSVVLTPQKKSYKIMYKSSKPSPSTLSLLRQASASTVNTSVNSPVSLSTTTGTKELVGLLKNKPSRGIKIHMLPNGQLDLVCDTDAELESLADDEYKVCKNCGTLSKNPNVCESCGKQLTGKDKTFKRDSKEGKLFKTAPNLPPVGKKMFYGNKLNQQWQAYSSEPRSKRASSRGGGVARRGRPPRSKRKTEPETVVISSDDEGLERREQQKRNHSTSTPSAIRTLKVNSADSSSSALNNSNASFEESNQGNDSMSQTVWGQSPKVGDKHNLSDDDQWFSSPFTKKVLVQGTRRDRMEDQSGKVPPGRRKKVCVVTAYSVESDLSVNLKARCVRMGLLRGTPVQPIFVSQQGFFIKMECTNSTTPLDVHISPPEIENLAVHMNNRLPVVFINPSYSCGCKLREQINLTEAQFLPGSPDLTLKFITLLLEPCSDSADHDILRCLFKEFEKLKPNTPRFLQLLNFEEANSVLVQTVQKPPAGSSEERSTPQKPDKPPETIFVYTTPEEKGGITVTTEDIAGLKDGEFLNDVIIDFYLKYILMEIISEEARKRTYVFSSFFYKRMILKHGKAAGKDLKIKRFESVQKWTKNIDIFSKDFVIVPINEYSHWFLAIICFPGMVTAEPDGAAPEEETQNNEVAQENPQEEGEEAQDGAADGADQQLQNMGALQTQPCILVFDSLAGPSKSHVVRILRDYLTLEWNAKHKTQRLFNRNTMKGGYPKVPQQNNSFDCGIYLMQFMESFFEQPIENYRIPIRGLENWFPLERVANKRQHIRELISIKAEKYNEGKADA